MGLVGAPLWKPFVLVAVRKVMKITLKSRRETCCGVLLFTWLVYVMTWASHFFERPLLSKAWQLPETQRLWSRAGVFASTVHWCMYEDIDCVGLPSRKATRVLGSGEWIRAVVQVCGGGRAHAKPLRGLRAKLAGAYPSGFCGLLAGALKLHGHGQA